MESIGIKLADGSFYPILEDGRPQKKNLALTTVKDNQTIVHVDLYRSSSGSMEDAQYVDTLEITNLTPHGNGEPNLSLDIELDGDNKLSAKIHDPETGRQVSLVSRTIEERGEPANFTIDHPSEEDTKTFEDIFNGKTDEPEPTFEDILHSISSDAAETQEKPFAITEDEVAGLDRNASAKEGVTSLGPAPDDDFAFDSLPGGRTRRPAKSRHQESDEPEDGEMPDFDESLFTDEQPREPLAAEPVSAGERAVPVTSLNGKESTDFDFGGASDEDAVANIELPDFNEPDAGSLINTEEDFDFGDGPISPVPAIEEPDFGSGEDDDTLVMPPEIEDGITTEVSETDFSLADDDDTPTLPPDSGNAETEDGGSGDFEFADEGAAFVMPPAAGESADDAGSGGFEFADEDAAFAMPPAVEAAVTRDAPADAADFDFADLDTSDVDLSKDIDLPDLPDFGSTDTASGTASAELPDFTELEETVNAGADDAFDLPDFGDVSYTAKAESVGDFDFKLPDFDGEEADSDFDLPDFGDLSATAAAGLAADTDFELPDFDDLSGSSDFDRLFGDDADAAPSSITPENMFNNLYDKETIEGKSSSAFEEEKDDEKKKTRIPVIICVACAIICLLSLLFLFVIPSKLNLISRQQDAQVASARTRQDEAGSGGNTAAPPVADTTQLPGDGAAGAGPQQPASAAGQSATANTGTGTTAPAAANAAPPPAQGAAEPVPAKENQIVVATVPSQVIPEQPAKSATKVPDIRYTVVWGDTLWDIANAYYKNPWRYRYLAQYNHLSNPNYIKAGSVILIPAE